MLKKFFGTLHFVSLNELILCSAREDATQVWMVSFVEDIRSIIRPVNQFACYIRKIRLV